VRSANFPRRRPLLVVLATAAAVVLTACGSNRVVPGDTVTETVGPAGHSAHAGGNNKSHHPSGKNKGDKNKKNGKPKTVVHVSALESDGATYGVGIPIVLYFHPLPTNSSAFTKAAKVKVNGSVANGAWFWEQPTKYEKTRHIIEAHYRLSRYWPANSDVDVNLPIGGLSAGKGKVYGHALNSVSFHIGASHVSSVDGQARKMTVTSNGRLVRTIEVSLGAAQTPTYTGVKVVMQKGENQPDGAKLRPDGAVEMIGPGYDELVDWSVRITQSGEYVHAAPWNSHIGQLNTSNGCTNLQVDTAKWFYQFSRLGDIVTYTHTDGTTMPSWDGLGDWNVPWPEWQNGGLLLNH
jgi:lipoprotein-anchoring transpeptidase ErfK/SrfK